MATLVDQLDTLTYWLLNVSSAFMLSAAHNVLFFLLDLRTPVLHCLHFVGPALFLLLRLALSPDRSLLPRLLSAIPRAPLRSLLWRPVVAQLAVTALAARVHSQNRAGGLYLCRIFDFLGTLFVIRFAPNFLTPAVGPYQNGASAKEEEQQQRRRSAICALLCPLACSASLSWLEFGHIEWDPWALCLAPVLALAQALHLLLLKRAQLDFFAALRAKGCECDDSLPAETFDRFALCYFVAVGVLLAPPALASYSQSVVPYDASWESIDYLLMGMSVVFMMGYKYSELWLISRLEPHHFCALEHTKYFLASIGQWFLQNMAHATVFAAIGKALFVVSALRYWMRADEMDAAAAGGRMAKEKCGPKSSLAG